MKKLSKNISLHRYSKRVIAISTDLGLCVLCTWLAFYLRLEELVKINNVTTLAVEISILIAIPIFWLMGLYKTIFRFQGSSIIFTVLIATSVYALLYFAVIGIYGIQGIPRSIGIIQPILLFLSISLSRISIKFLFLTNFKKSKNKTNVHIIDRQPVQIVKNMIKKANFGLVSLDSNVYKYSYPGKIMTYLEQGTPIIAVLEKDSEIAKLMEHENYGFCITPSEPKKISEYLIKLLENNSWKLKMNSNALSAYEKYFAKDIILSKWSDVLLSK